MMGNDQGERNADGEVTKKKVFSLAFMALSIKGMSAVGGLMLGMLLARQLGPESTGNFYLSYAIVLITSIACRMGACNQILAELSGNACEMDTAESACQFVANSFGAALSGSAVLLVGSDFLAGVVFKNPDLSIYIKVSSIGLVPYTMTFVFSALNQSAGQLAVALLTQNFVVYFVSAFALVLLGENATGVLACLAFVLGACVSMVLSFVRYSMQNRNMWSLSLYRPSVLAARSGVPFLSVDLLFAANNWLPLILVGSWFAAEKVGYFSIASRISWLAAFLLVSVNSVVAPEFSKYFKKGMYSELKLLYYKCVLFVAVFTMPFLFFAVANPGFVLSFFGSEFSNATVTLQILLMAQLVNTCTGPINFVLLMSGNAVAVNLSSGLGLLVGLGLMAALVVPFGITGATVGAAASSVIANLSMVLFAVFRTEVFSRRELS